MEYHFIIPDYLKNLGKVSEVHKTWLESLPIIIEKIRKLWSINLEYPLTEDASNSFVCICTTKSQKKAVLKIGFPHSEARDEIDGLMMLQGSPSVKLLKYNKQVNAMLLEYCDPGTSLKAETEEFQDGIICQLLSEIWETKIKASNFRPLAEMVDQWNQETYAAIENFPDPELAREGCRMKNELIRTSAKRTFLVTDLHAGNVLRAQRRPWLVIDIKPYLGDRNYDLTQHLMNCRARLENDPLETIAKMAVLSNCDHNRLRRWLFARLATENEGAYQSIASALRL